MIMLLEKLKNEAAVTFRAALGEFRSAVRSSFICAPVLTVALLANCEITLFDRNMWGVHIFVYVIALLLGVGMGVGAVSHMYTSKGEALMYRSLPMGGIRTTVLRLAVRLLASTVIIFLSFLLFYVSIGERYPDFYLNPTMVWVMQRGAVLDYSVCFSGIRAWALYGIMDFGYGFVFFLFGYSLGAFCGSGASSAVRAALTSILSLSVGLAIPLSLPSSSLKALEFFEGGGSVADIAISPLNFLLCNETEFLVEACKFWVLPSCVMLVLTVFISRGIRFERHGRLFAGRRTAVAFTVIFLFLGFNLVIRNERLPSVILDFAEFILDPDRLFG